MKTFRFVARFMLIAAALFAAALGIAACGSDPYEFAEGERETVEHYEYTFQPYVLKRGPLTVGTEQDLYTAEGARVALFKAIEADMGALKAVFPRGKSIRLFVLSDARASALPLGIYADGTVYVKESAVESGEYRLFLSAAYLGTGEPWKAYAARAAAFGETSEISESALASYYTRQPEAASLFAAYFFEGFADEETRAYAVAGAEAFGAFLREQRGAAAIGYTRLDADRAEFLASLGVTAAYPGGDHTFLDGASYTTDDEFSLVVETKDRRWFLDPIPAKTEFGAEYAMDTPARVLARLTEADADLKALMETVAKQAPVEYKRIKARFARHIDYALSPDEPQTYVGSQTVRLNDLGEIVSATARLLISDPEGAAWLETGVAEYFARFLVRRASETTRRAYLCFSGDGSGLTDDELAFVQEVKTRYLAAGGSLDDFVAYDHARILEAIAYVTLRTPAYKETVDLPLATVPLGGGESAGEGAALTLPEAYLFAKYLIARFGMDDVLEAVRTELSVLGDYYTLQAAFLREIEAGRTSWTLKLPAEDKSAFYNDMTFIIFVVISVAAAVAVVLLLTPKKKKKK